MDNQAIKAQLYDLQYHNCDGRLTIRADGKRDPDDRPCWGCSRVMELHAMLRRNAEAKRKPGVPSRQQMYEILKARSLQIQAEAEQVQGAMR